MLVISLNIQLKVVCDSDLDSNQQLSVVFIGLVRFDSRLVLNVQVLFWVVKYIGIVIVMFLGMLWMVIVKVSGMFIDGFFSVVKKVVSFFGKLCVVIVIEVSSVICFRYLWLFLWNVGFCLFRLLCGLGMKWLISMIMIMFSRNVRVLQVKLVCLLWVSVNEVMDLLRIFDSDIQIIVLLVKVRLKVSRCGLGWCENSISRLLIVVVRLVVRVIVSVIQMFLGGICSIY